MLLPPLQDLKKLENELRQLELHATKDGAMATLTKWLELIAGTQLMDAMDLSDFVIRIKLGGDGFKMTRANGEVNFYFTLFNLGTLIHSPLFVFTLGCFEGKEESSLLKDNLPPLLQDIDQLQVKGIYLPYRYSFFLI